MEPKFSYSFKWIGGGLGWFLGGPVGGVLGFVAGTVTESLFLKTEEKRTTNDFSINLLVIVAAVLKAKMPVADSKVRLVKQFLKKNYGEEYANEALVHLNIIFKQNIPLDEACANVRSNLEYSSRLQLIQFLYKLTKMDGELNEAEQLVLNVITAGLRITYGNKQSAKPAIVQSDAITSAYKILEVNSYSSVDDIKKAYRKLVVNYHPDKVVHLNDLQKKAANEKFLQLTDAYKLIKRERKFA